MKFQYSLFLALTGCESMLAFQPILTTPATRLHPVRITRSSSNKKHGGSPFFPDFPAIGATVGLNPSADDVSERPAASQSGGSATITQEVFNLVKSIVGAGVLGLPAGIAAFGNAPGAVYPASFLIIAIGVVSGYGFGLIGRSCALTGSTSFREAWTKSVSEQTSWIPPLSVTLKTCFAILAYSMILKDTFYALTLGAGFHVNKTLLLSALTTTILLPLCLLKDLSSLAPFSLLGSLGMLYTGVAMTIRFFGKAYVPTVGRFAKDVPAALLPSFGSTGASGAFSPAVTILLGMLSTSYMCHFNAPKFYTELQNNTIPRFMRVVATSFGAAILLTVIMASMGFLTFGASSSGLILNNYSPRDTLMGLSRISVVLSLLFSYPLSFLGARDGVLDLLKVKNRSTPFLNTLTVGMLAGITFLATVIPDVSFVLAFGGATLGNAIIYIFPSLMFVNALKKLPNVTKAQKREVPFAIGTAAFGLVMGVMGAVKAVQNIL